MAESGDSSVGINVNTQKQNKVIVQPESNDDNKTEKVMESLRLGDSINGLPRSFVLLEEEVIRRDEKLQNEHDIVASFLYIMMLEEGFIPLDYKEPEGTPSISYNKTQVEAACRYLPKNWKRNDSHYQFTFTMHPFPLITLEINCIVASDADLIVNCRIKKLNDYSSILLDPKLYIVMNEHGWSYQNLRGLATTFKNKIAWRARCIILQRNQIPAPQLRDLPPELKAFIQRLARANTRRNLIFPYY